MKLNLNCWANHPEWRRRETGPESQKVTPLQTRCLPKPIPPSNGAGKGGWRSWLRVCDSMSVKRYSEIGRQAQFHAWNPSDLPELNELWRVRKWSRAMDAICPPTPLQISSWAKKRRNPACMPPLGEHWRQQPILPYKSEVFWCFDRHEKMVSGEINFRYLLKKTSMS